VGDALLERPASPSLPPAAAGGGGGSLRQEVPGLGGLVGSGDQGGGDEEDDGALVVARRRRVRSASQPPWEDEEEDDGSMQQIGGGPASMGLGVGLQQGGAPGAGLLLPTGQGVGLGAAVAGGDGGAPGEDRKGDDALLVYTGGALGGGVRVGWGGKQEPLLGMEWQQGTSSSTLPQELQMLLAD
jgi:hypothetical protein